MSDHRPKISAAWRQHERRWADNRYVYAVVSRRSRGLSVGVNLNPDKGCNFDCIYCQVDRTVPPLVRKVDVRRLADELDLVLEAARGGRLFDAAPFDVLGADDRQVRDISFSGDGEPTTCPAFGEAVQIAADARRRFGLAGTKIVLITDAAYLDRPKVRTALLTLDANNGEIWAKLDAGTEEYYKRVNRSNVPFQAILDNIRDAAMARPIVIQSLWMRIHDAGPPPDEIEAYCRRLNGVLAASGLIKAVQIYTIARRPAEAFATPLSDDELDRIAALVRTSVAVPVESFYGVTA
jgi:wyosine [tRNA(Phe)-imidazoG37] synthetase (radical SAM superfamily)